MKKLGIHSVIRKKKKKYTYTKPDETAENIIQRDFYASAPNQKWATDVTEFKVPGEKKKLYLKRLTGRLQIFLMPGRFFIQTGDSSIPAGCFRRNLKSRK